VDCGIVLNSELVFYAYARRLLWYHDHAYLISFRKLRIAVFEERATSSIRIVKIAGIDAD
jgi:hypothetical protein